MVYHVYETFLARSSSLCPGRRQEGNKHKNIFTVVEISVFELVCFH